MVQFQWNFTKKGPRKMTLCKTCGYSSWCDCPKADDKNVNANEIADELNRLQQIHPLSIPFVLDEAATMLRQLQADKNQLEFALFQSENAYEKQQAEIEALKAFVKPIIAHGDDCIGNWDGDELQDLAVKTGLLIEVEKTQFCNLNKEEFIACPCREYNYDEESWICLNTAKFLLGEVQEKCNHSNFVKTEHLTGEGAMEYVEWFDNTCSDCGEHWTTNN